jgi:heptosyltransferase II
MRKILLLALSGIGDALMFTPALKLLREEYPSAEIDALVMYKGVKDIYERQPDLNKTYYFDFIKEGTLRSLVFIMSIRKKYDTTISVYPSNRKEYNTISFLIGAKKRAGVRYLRKDKENFGWMNNIRITEQDTAHNVITNIKLIEKLTGKKFNQEPPLSFPLTPGDAAFANQFLEKNDISPGETIIGFHPGSAVLKNHIKRRWEPEKFAELGSKLIREKNAVILIFGGPDESELKNLIKEKINSPKVFSVSSGDLAESAALIGKCSLFISNDSSLMHVAAAMEIKTIAIIGPTNPAYIHPWKTEHKIVSLNLECAPCFIYSPRPLICFREDVKFKCIKELSVDMVFDAALSMLD